MLSVQLNPINVGEEASDDEGSLGGDLADYAEMEYFCQAALSVASTLNPGKATNNLTGARKGPLANGGKTPSDDFIGMDNPEDAK